MNCLRMIAAAGTVAFAGGALGANVTLRASHQFPGGKGDVRDEMVQMIARDAKAANVGLEVQVYPGAALFKANEQWNALVNGQLDISSFPLDYASGKVRAFGATLMPGLVRSHERAARINNSAFMKEIKAKIDKAGVIVLSDAWLAGAIASKKACIRTPNDIKGLKVRSAGPTFAAMWQSAGASIVSIPSNEVYNALQTGVADATDTNVDSIRALNPELKRDVTPRGESYNVRIPAGRSNQFVALLKRIPVDRRETARVIPVAPGEDLTNVSSRTGLSVAQLQAMNGGVDLKNTTKLVVPNSNVKLTRWVRPKVGTETETAPGAGIKTIRARKGDTIRRISEANSVDANDVARLNGITADADLRAGQEIKLPATSNAPSRRR